MVRPWTQKAGATFTTLVDRHNDVGRSYGVKFVPVVIHLDEEGRLVRPVAQADIGDEEFYQQLVQWVENGTVPSQWQQGAPRSPQGLSQAESRADALFQNASALLKEDRRTEAIAALKEAFRLDPKNWLIRKQLWAIENPAAFYEGPVDYKWQKDQMQREAADLAP